MSALMSVASKEEVVIKIKGKQLAEKIQFLVEDNGPGIEKEYAEKIFKLFATLAPKSTESTGVGLAIVKKNIEIWGGEVFLQTDPYPKQGACFIVNFPLG